MLFNIAAYVTVGAVGLIGLLVIRDANSRWIAAVLLLAFGILLSLFSRAENHARLVHLYFAIQTLILFGLWHLQPEDSPFGILFFVLSAQVMLLLPPRIAALWILVFTVLTGYAYVFYFGWLGLLWVLPNAGGYLFFATFGNLLRQTEMARRRSQQLLEELQAAQRQLQELAVAEERNRLSREVHDSLGHRLTVAVVQLEGAQRLIPSDPDRAARMIGAMREQMKEALADLRRTVATLRAPLEADLPLTQSLSRLATDFQEATGLAIHLTLPDDRLPLSEANRLGLYRAAQEALTNIQKHAEAKQAWLTLSVDDGQLILSVADDGKGFPSNTDQTGLGLRGLRERAAQLRGELLTEARPGGGAQVRLSLPVEGHGSNG